MVIITIFIKTIITTINNIRPIIMTITLMFIIIL